MDISKYINLDSVPQATKDMVNNLPNQGKLALINYYNENSDFFKVASNGNMAKNLYLDIENKNLYHYTTFNSLQKIIESKTFLMKSSKYMNDKKEIIYTFDLCNEMLKKLNASKIAIKQFNQFIESSPYNDFYIWSFTENEKSQCLYGYYSNGNDGIALKFNGEDIMHDLGLYFSRGKSALDEYTIGNAFVLPEKVIYNENKQIEILKPILEEYLMAYDTYSLDPNDMNIIIKNCINSIIFYSMCFKRQDLYQEEEVRFIANNITIGRKQSPDKIINNIPFMTIPFEPSLLKECILQPKSKISLQKISQELKKNRFTKTKVSNSTLPY